MRSPVRTGIALLIVAVAAAGCDRGKAAESGSVAMAGQTVSTSKLLSIASGLCDAADLAGRNNVNSSRATFFGQSHDGLHLIARGLQDVDRGASATVLEAKQKVEADFGDLSPAPQVANDLRHLADVTRSSLTRFKVTADACPPAPSS